MKILRWLGWVIAAVALSLTLLTTVYAQLIPQQPVQPAIDAHLVIQSDGTFYLIHDDTKFAVPLSDMSDAQLRTIPDATVAQWGEHFAVSDRPTPPEPSVGPGAPLEMPAVS